MSVTLFSKSVVWCKLCLGLLLVLSGCGEDAAPSAGASQAQEPQAESMQEAADAPQALTATGAYLRQPAPGQTMLAAFVTFRNDSDQAYTLNHVSSPRASAVEVHRTMYNDGVMSMRHVHHLAVPPKSELVFKPGGYHLMLSGVEGELKPGDAVPFEFHFEGGARLSVSAEVRPIR